MMKPPTLAVARAGSALALALGVLVATGTALGGVAEASKPTGTTITIGVLGTYANNNQGPTQDVPNALSAWQKYVNAHGGIHGHPVQYINIDDGRDSGKAQAGARTLIESDHVPVIMDASQVGTAYEPIPAAAHVPVIGLAGAGGSFVYETDPDWFAAGTTVQGLLFSQVYLAKSVGGTVYGAIYCSELPQCAQAVPLWKTNIALIPGLKFGLAVAASSSAPDFTAQCVALQQANVNVMFPITGSSTVATDCARQGYHPKYIGSQQTIHYDYASNPNLQGAVQSIPGFPWMLNKTPAQKEFQAAEGKVWPTSVNPQIISAAWQGLQLLQAAIGKLPAKATLTSQDVLSGLYALHKETLGGLAATPLTFTPGKPTTERCWFVTQILKKKWVAFNGGKPQCESPSLYTTS